jgi:hypothetical protein
MIFNNDLIVPSRAALRLIPTPVNDRMPGRPTGGTWAPIQHGVLADTVATEIVDAGHTIVAETWRVNPQKTSLWGSVDFDLNPYASHRMGIGQRAYYSLGVTHGNTRTNALRFFIGIRVACCSNAFIASEFTASRRHTKNIDLQEEVQYALDMLYASIDTINEMVQELRALPVTNGEAALIIINAGEYKLIEPPHVLLAHQLWRRPPYIEFAEPTLWSLYNVFSEIMKKYSAKRQLEVITDLRDFILDKQHRN